MRATVWRYDVWGNERDGFEVNDRNCFVREAEFPAKTISAGDDDKSLLKWLKDIGFIKKGIHLSSINFDGDDTTIYIEQSKNGYPIGCIEIESD